MMRCVRVSVSDQGHELLGRMGSSSEVLSMLTVGRVHRPATARCLIGVDCGASRDNESDHRGWREANWSACSSLVPNAYGSLATWRKEEDTQ